MWIAVQAFQASPRCQFWSVLVQFARFFDKTDRCQRDGEVRVEGWLIMEGIVDRGMEIEEGLYHAIFAYHDSCVIPP